MVDNKHYRVNCLPIKPGSIFTKITSVAISYTYLRTNKKDTHIFEGQIHFLPYLREIEFVGYFLEKSLIPKDIF